MPQASSRLLLPHRTRTAIIHAPRCSAPPFPRGPPTFAAAAAAAAGALVALVKLEEEIEVELGLFLQAAHHRGLAERSGAGGGGPGKLQRIFSSRTPPPPPRAPRRDTCCSAACSRRAAWATERLPCCGPGRPAALSSCHKSQVSQQQEEQDAKASGDSSREGGPPESGV